jgi:hypothetical protein
VGGLWLAAVRRPPQVDTFGQQSQAYLRDLPFDVLMPLGFFIISAVLIWRKRVDRMALLVAVMLVFLGPYLISGVNNVVHTWGGVWPWVNIVLVNIGCVLFILYLFLFPTGRFVPRWSSLVVLTAAPIMLVADIIDGVPQSQVAIVPFFAAVAIGVAAQAYRYRTVSTPAQQQQTKWILVGLLAPVTIVFWWFFVTIPGIVPLPEEPFLYFAHQLVFATLALAFPLTIAVSVLRYRLWDIDIIIRRTLIYTLLTAVLMLVYLGSIISLQAMVRVVTGQSQSSLVTVISTLGIAALFSPLRRRIQGIIDRRFYRRKVDATKALEAFGQTARDEVDLTRLADRLLAVVDDTVQPAQASLWLRPDRSEAPK